MATTSLATLCGLDLLTAYIAFPKVAWASTAIVAAARIVAKNFAAVNSTNQI
jgi:hypothetical protein